MDEFYSRMWKAYQAIPETKLTEDMLQSSTSLKKHVMTPKQRKNAKGKYLPGKLKVLEDLGDLREKERRFIEIAHEYRNELYHIGLGHDEIVRAIAGEYFLLGCALLVRLQGSGFFTEGISSNDVYSDVSKRYLPVRNGRLDLFNVDQGDLAKKLRNALPNGLPNLPKTLAKRARKYIESMMKEFDFLVADNPFGFDGNKMLEIAQWQYDLNETLAKEGVDGVLADPNFQKEFLQVSVTLLQSWKQKHTSIPCKRWMLRANRVGRQSDPHIAMDIYQSLRNDMSYLEEAIQTASEDLDRWIQTEIDIARGK